MTRTKHRVRECARRHRAEYAITVRRSKNMLPEKPVCKRLKYMLYIKKKKMEIDTRQRITFFSSRDASSRVFFIISSKPGVRILFLQGKNEAISLFGFVRPIVFSEVLWNLKEVREPISSRGVVASLLDNFQPLARHDRVVRSARSLPSSTANLCQSCARLSR